MLTHIRIQSTNLEVYECISRMHKIGRPNDDVLWKKYYQTYMSAASLQFFLWFVWKSYSSSIKFEKLSISIVFKFLIDITGLEEF